MTVVAALLLLVCCCCYCPDCEFDSEWMILCLIKIRRGDTGVVCRRRRTIEIRVCCVTVFQLVWWLVGGFFAYGPKESLQSNSKIRVRTIQ